MLNWIKRKIFGECPDCKVLLLDRKGWARGDCPMCGKHYNYF